MIIGRKINVQAKIVDLTYELTKKPKSPSLLWGETNTIQETQLSR